jgi:hypothetical protein
VVTLKSLVVERQVETLVGAATVEISENRKREAEELQRRLIERRRLGKIPPQFEHRIWKSRVFEGRTT